MERQLPGEDPFGDTVAAAGTDATDAENSAGASHELALGDKLGRFEIVRQLGVGGMGVVYVALDPTLNRQVAVKLLKSVEERPIAAAAARARMIREAQAMARLSHPNVITVHEVGTVDDQVFIVMELNDGQTLGQWIKEQRGWREIVDLFLQAGLGLSAAHEADLIHRDFKPDNVLIGRNGRVRVTDFGLVDSSKNPEKVLRDHSVEPRASEGGMLAVALTHTGAMLGTPPYMAPEQHDAAAADSRTDQFSFCVSLFEALYGYRPFQGSTYRALVVAILDDHRQERPADTDVPDELHQILLRGLSNNRDDRFGSMKELLDALASVSVAQPSALVIPKNISQARRATEPRFSAFESVDSGFQHRPSRRGWLVATGAFVAVAALATVVIVRGQSKSNEGNAQTDSSEETVPGLAIEQIDASQGVTLVGTTVVPIDAGSPAISIDAKPGRGWRGNDQRKPPKSENNPESNKPTSKPAHETKPAEDKIRELTPAEKAALRRAEELNLDLSGGKAP